jgi:hypothetical protein
VSFEVLQELFRLRRDKYPDFSVTHFHPPSLNVAPTADTKKPFRDDSPRLA